MARYFSIRPEVAGHFGARTVMLDGNARPPLVSRFHYECEGWPEDELIETILTFMASPALVANWRAAELTGFDVGQVEVTIAEDSEELDLMPDKPIPPFVWLKITGNPGIDDFGIVGLPHPQFVISERALKILRRHRMKFAKVEPYK